MGATLCNDSATGTEPRLELVTHAGPIPGRAAGFSAGAKIVAWRSPTIRPFDVAVYIEGLQQSTRRRASSSSWRRSGCCSTG